jgi:hypothetical protein
VCPHGALLQSVGEFLRAATAPAGPAVAAREWSGAMQAQLAEEPFVVVARALQVGSAELAARHGNSVRVCEAWRSTLAAKKVPFHHCFMAE